MWRWRTGGQNELWRSDSKSGLLKCFVYLHMLHLFPRTLSRGGKRSHIVFLLLSTRLCLHQPFLLFLAYVQCGVRLWQCKYLVTKLVVVQDLGTCTFRSWGANSSIVSPLRQGETKAQKMWLDLSEWLKLNWDVLRAAFPSARVLSFLVDLLV